MLDLILKLYDDEGNVIYEQVMFDTTDSAIYEHAEKLRDFFKAREFQTYDYSKDR